MGILQRFSDIMRSNINALLDRAEDPAKMVDQYLLDLRKDLAEVKSDTAEVIANEKAAQRAVRECEENIAKYANAARNAVKAGQDEDAKVLLTKKQQFESQLAGLKQNQEAATANADKMRQLYQKLTNDISDLEARRNTIHAKVATANAQKKVNQVVGGSDRANDAMDAFARMERKADKMLDSAEATASLNSEAVRAEDLADKYAASGSSVDDELAALKAELNQ